ncbi:MAG: type II toxin-antitoxin system RelB/DinJ family antitoxin [Clostridiales bacterium]|nr:type II toxin-antitoxin system RelB/DinJ family antitoxin [Clostridiales bacterium]
MANTSAVYARIDTGLKDSAESILAQLGITPSSAIQMLYSQIVLQKGMPFDLRLPDSKPTAIGGMSREKLDVELLKGIESLKSGKAYTADEVDAELAREFGI